MTNLFDRIMWGLTLLAAFMMVGGLIAIGQHLDHLSESARPSAAQAAVSDHDKYLIGYRSCVAAGVRDYAGLRSGQALLKKAPSLDLSKVDDCQGLDENRITQAEQVILEMEAEVLKRAPGRTS